MSCSSTASSSLSGAILLEVISSRCTLVSLLRIISCMACCRRDIRSTDFCGKSDHGGLTDPHRSAQPGGSHKGHLIRNAPSIYLAIRR